MRASATGAEAEAAVAPAGRYTVRSVARALQLVDIVAEGPAEGQTLSADQSVSASDVK